MIAVDVVLDAFINANILFFIGYVFWLGVRGVMRRIGLKHDYGTQLNLLNAVFFVIVLAPLIALTFRLLLQSGYGLNINLSDMVVAYYLNGGLDMKASEFEALVLMRDTFTLNVANGQGLVAQIAITIFLLGVVLGAVRLGYSVHCLWSIVRHGYAWRRFGRVCVRLSDRTLVPFSTRGLRNYYVVIPSHMLENSAELRVSLAHELQHIRQGDLEWEIVLEFLKPFFFLNPAFRAWKSQVEHLRELTCDSAVLSRGRIAIREYCDTLLSVCQKTLRKDRAFVIAVPKVTLVTADRASIFGNNYSFLERRVRSLLSFNRPRYQRLVFGIIAVPLLAAVTLTCVAIQSPGDWSHDRLMLSTVVNLERLDEINRQSTFGRLRN